jgi:adenylate cyclase
MSLKIHRQWRQRVTFAIGLGIGLGAMAFTPAGQFLNRLGIDFLLPARHAVSGPLFSPGESRVVVVVIDEETYATPPFSGTPRVAWTPMLAKVLDRIDAAGAAVIGLDMIYPTTLATRQLLPGYDKPLLQTFFKLGRAGRLVLGETRLSRQTIRPYRSQVIAVGGPGNVRPLNVVVDADQVVRSYPASFREESGGTVSSMAAELVTRAGGVAPAGRFLVNYNTGAHDIPSYSLADLFHCPTAGGEQFFSRAFTGKIVLLGSALDVEDRVVPAKRFAKSESSGSPPERCTTPPEDERFGSLVARRSMPGIYVHAAAVNTLLRKEPLQLLTPAGGFLLLAVGMAILSLTFFAVSPLSGFVLTLSVIAGHGGVALVWFKQGLVLPVVLVAIAGLIAFSIVYAYRMVVEDRQKRRIKQAFGHYLAPSLVERLAEDVDPSDLGGEMRRVTVLFTDIADYTALSETMSDRPDQLVKILNRYFTVLVGEVERHGGYVVSYIGDAVMAVWGAPLSDQQAEINAVEAALSSMEALDELNREIVEGEFGLSPITTRLGINTGIALVGNTGSATRLNYTVTGDTTNIAARLEGANKIYGTRLMIGEETARALGTKFLLRRLDRLVVKGKSRPVKVYEVIGNVADASAARVASIRAYHAAMALYYRRRFALAREAFSRLMDEDVVAGVFAERCRRFEKAPPLENWDHSFELDSK